MEPLTRTDPRQLGPYKILGRLGEGGMGVVFKGASPNGTFVAIKVVRQSVIDEDPGFRDQFEREVEATKAAGADLAPQVVHIDLDAPLPWYASEFVEGPTLQMTVQKAPLDAVTACKLGIRLARALKSIHAEGFIHNDLTPRNIIMSEDGPKIIDFGIVSVQQAEAHRSSNTDSGVVWGTAGYVSPEQLARGATTPASDIYALGVVLFFATTRRLPFPGESGDVINDRTGSDGQPNLSAVPLALRRTISRCLRKQPDSRPSPREVVESLAYDRRELWAAQERPQNHRSAEPPPTMEELIHRKMHAEKRVARGIDLREPLRALWIGASSLVQRSSAALLAIDVRALFAGVLRVLVAVCAGFLRALVTVCGSVLEAPIVIRVLIAATVISVVPGYSLVHWVDGRGGVLLGAAIYVIVVITLAIERWERTDPTKDESPVTSGIAVLGWFSCGLCAFILTLTKLEATWWKRILIAAVITLFLGLLLGAIAVFSYVSEEITSAVIGVGWGMLIAAIVVALLNWAAAASLGVSIGSALLSLIVVSGSVTLLLFDD